MKLKLKRMLNMFLFVLLLYLIYFLLSGVLPFRQGKDLPTEYKDSIDSYQFVREEPSVDRVALVEDPMTSLEARVNLISQAEHTIDISYYSVHMGGTSDFFFGAVLDAADRGVKVRILLDGLSGGLTKQNRDYATALGAHKNIELRLYNVPNPLKPWTFNARMHDKYIIIDNKLLLLGGRNLGDKYFNPEGFSKSLSIDRDILVFNTAYDTEDYSSVLFEVRDYMDAIWNSDTVTEPFSQDTKKGASLREHLYSMLQQVRTETPALFDHEVNYYETTLPTNHIAFLHNDFDIGVKAPKVGYAIAKLLLSAQESAFLQSPYLVLDENSKNVLMALGQKEILYEILTNSLASSPNVLAYSAYLNDRKEILATGAEVLEYQSKHAIHAKTYLIDDRLCIAGSYNLDPRSAYIDTELMLVIDSVEFAAHMREVLGTYQKDSLLVDSNGNYVPKEGVAIQDVSPMKQIMITVLRVVVRPFTFLV